MINQNFKLTKIIDPYKIWILDDFLEPSYCNNLNKSWPNQDLPIWNKGVGKLFDKDGVLEDKMIAISGKENIPEPFHEFLTEITSNERLNFFKDLTNMEEITSDSSWRWSGLRETLKGGHQLIHIDARQHIETGLTKELTMLLYLNDDYEEDRDAGQLEIWSADMKEKMHSIPPFYNRLVIFHNTDTSFHGVPETRNNRKMITWSMLNQKISSGDTRAKFVQRPDDPSIVKELSDERLKVKDKFQY